MRTCEEYEALISAFIDGALADEDRAELMAHMAECPACQAYFDDQIAIHDALADMEVKAPEGFADRVMAQVRQESRQAPVSEKQEKKTVPFPLWRRYAAMAACCAIVAIAGFWAFNGGQLGTGNVAADTALMDSRSAPVVENQENDAAESSTPADAAVADAVGDAPLSDEQPVQDTPADAPVPETDDRAAEGQDAGEPETFSVTTADSETDRVDSAENRGDSSPEQYAAKDSFVSTAYATAGTVTLTTDSALAEAWVAENLGQTWEAGASYALTVEQFDQVQALLEANGESFLLAMPMEEEAPVSDTLDDDTEETEEALESSEEPIEPADDIPAEEEEEAPVFYVLQAAP